LQNSIPTGLNHRRQSDDIDALLDAGADSGNLIFLFLLGIREDQFDA